jgi:hypothetical protein
VTNEYVWPCCFLRNGISRNLELHVPTTLRVRQSLAWGRQGNHGAVNLAVCSIAVRFCQLFELEEFRGPKGRTKSVCSDQSHCPSSSQLNSRTLNSTPHNSTQLQPDTHTIVPSNHSLHTHTSGTLSPPPSDKMRAGQSSRVPSQSCSRES